MAMARRPSLHRILVLAAAVVLPFGAQAFTIDDGTYQTPKFDLEEQTRNFRATSPDVSTPGRQQVETPFGKLQFGVETRQSPFGPESAARNRRHYERMFAPDFLKDRY
jgi:hypothetical protein